MLEHSVDCVTVLPPTYLSFILLSSHVTDFLSLIPMILSTSPSSGLTLSNYCWQVCLLDRLSWFSENKCYCSHHGNCFDWSEENTGGGFLVANRVQ